jgi:hypothetical protein
VILGQTQFIIRKIKQKPRESGESLAPPGSNSHGNHVHSLSCRRPDRLATPLPLSLLPLHSALLKPRPEGITTISSSKRLKNTCSHQRRGKTLRLRNLFGGLQPRMRSLRPLDPSFAVSASARPRRGLAQPAYGGGSAGVLRRHGAVAAPGRRRGFSCRVGSATSAAERLPSCCFFYLLCFR